MTEAVGSIMRSHLGDVLVLRIVLMSRLRGKLRHPGAL